MFIIGVVCLLKVLFPNNLRQTKTTFWRAPSERREELAWFSCRCVFYTVGHSINDALALRGKRATGAPGDAPSVSSRLRAEPPRT